MSVFMLAACAAPRGPRMGEDARARVEAEFKKVDSDQDENLSRDEFTTGIPDLATHFDEIDLDGNQRVNLAELWNYVEWKRLAHAPEPRAGSRRR